MKESVLDKVKELTIRAQNKGKEEVQVQLRSDYTTALNEAIKTKEEAAAFMRMLRSIDLEVE